MYNIACVSGDGVGPEIVTCAKNVLTATAEKFGFNLGFTEAVMGGAAIDACGNPMPQNSLDICKSSDAVLLGAVGGPKWDYCSPRPESALLGLRKALNLYANFRKVRLYSELRNSSPLSSEIAEKGIDYIIVRELTGGMYFGEKGYRNGKFGREAYDTEVYGELEIERIARQAFELAEMRGRKLISIDKANVLESSRLWRKVVHDVNEDYPTVVLDDLLVDNAAMQLVLKPSDFDVIVTSNMFGDILSDLGAATVGSIGMLASASLGDTSQGMYEAIHGSAPSLAGKNVVNPIATILSGAMLLRHSLNKTEAADAIEAAVEKTLKESYRTFDIADRNTSADYVLTTTDMTAKIIQRI